MKARGTKAKVERVAPRAPSSANKRVRITRNGAQVRTVESLPAERAGVTRPTSGRVLTPHGVTRPTLKRSLRPGIERNTLLMPWVIADSVIQEASHFLDVQLPLEWSDWLDRRAERCYANHKQFRQLVRRKGETGRGYLFRFFRHWLAGKLDKTNKGLFRRLPHQYLLGDPLPSRR